MSNLLFAQKPAGFSTHSPQDKIEGFVEILEKHHQEKLFVVHRLDKETSGAMVFSKTKDMAAQIAKDFELHKIEKTYHFVSSQKGEFSSKNLIGDIHKSGKSYEFQESTSGNSETYFELVQDLGPYQLWMARPKTGKTHQIRLHAKHLGIPILGDSLYGEKEAPRLFLHCSSMKGESWSHSSSLPKSFTEISQLATRQLQWLVAIERRYLYFENLGSSAPTCFRLIHKEDQVSYLDNIEGQLWFSDFDEKDQSQSWKDFFGKFQETFSWKNYLYRKMINRGKDPENKDRDCSPDFPLEWQGFENSYHFLARRDQGQSMGIFLDQRKNRDWVYENSNSKKVLNLFSYTSVFSVAAACGGAELCHSVDTSKASLEWSKENFRSNGIDPEKHKFYSMEAEDFLSYCIKKKLQYDIIICDPPSFARNKSKVFKLEKELQALTQKSWACLKPGGYLLFSSNFEAWTLERFRQELLDAVTTPAEEVFLSPCYDFEAPGKERTLKSVLLKKRH